MRAATRNIIRKIWYGGWIFAASFLIMLALAFSAIRLMLPLATDYKTDIESLVSRLAGHPARIARIDTDWNWFRPRLKLIGVRLEDAASGSELFVAEEIILAMNPFSSIVNRRVEIDEFTVVRTNFSLRRDEAGSIRVEGLALPVQMEPAAAGTDLVPDFLHDRTLRVVDSVIGFADVASGMEYQLEAVNLAVRSGRQDHRIYLSIGLPEEIGARFEAGAELRGDLRDLQSLRGRLFMHASDLELPGVLRKTSYRDSVKSGRLDFALWAELDADQGREVQGNVNLQNFAGDFAGIPLLSGLQLPFDRMSADLQARLEGSELELELENLTLAKGENAAPVTGLGLKTSLAGPSRFMRGEIMIDHVRLQDISPVVLHSPKLQEALSSAGITGIGGDILQFYGRWDLAAGRRDIALITRFEELGVSGSGKTPSISALRGKARVFDNKAVVDFETIGSQFDYPRMFRNKLELRNLAGSVFARYSDSALTLAARELFLQTPHIVSRHWFDLRLASGQAPYANLYSTYEDGDVKSAGQYYPVTVMSKNLVKWLEEAVIGGRLVAGDLELRGPLDKFPFRHNEGIFRIDTDFDGMEVNYFREWPHLENARLHTKFYGATMGIALHEGRISGADIVGADVWITDFRNSWMIARTPLYGPLSGVADYLRSSGLREHVDPLIDQVAATGMQAGLLRMDIPLHDGPDTRWDFTSSILDGGLAFGEVLKFGNIDATIRINDESLQAEPFAASLNGHPISVDIATYAEQAGNTARIEIAGEVAPADVLPKIGFDLAGYFGGAAALSAAIDLPMTGTPGVERNPVIEASLDASAMAIDLPAPFTKQAGVPAVLSMRTEFRDGFVLSDIGYADWLNGKLRFQAGALERADIRLFNGRPRLPQTAGIFITGRLDELNIDQWLALRGAGAATVNPLQHLELKARRLGYLGRSLNDATLRLTQQSERWVAAVESEFLTGSVTIPKQGIIRPGLAFEVKYFNFDRIFSESPVSDKRLLPGDIPPFTLRAEEVLLNGWNLRQVELAADVDAGRQTLRSSVKIGDPDVGLEGSAQWSADKKGVHRTQINLTFNSENVGRGLGKFGYAEVISRGTGTAKFDLDWPASPHGFSLELIRGEGEISIKDGQVLDIKPGGGRLFGLLSVQTIPRRLAFDFRDIFEEGFRFDKMKGRFDFSEGNAYTDNYYIDGPAGRIDITGRVGMVQRDYDQKILFRPDLSSSLPIVGTLLGGAGTGIALIMVDRVARLFGKQTDDLARLEYTLTGSWDDSVITPVKQPRKKSKDK